MPASDRSAYEIPALVPCHWRPARRVETTFRPPAPSNGIRRRGVIALN